MWNRWNRQKTTFCSEPHFGFLISKLKSEMRFPPFNNLKTEILSYTDFIMCFNSKITL